MKSIKLVKTCNRKMADLQEIPSQKSEYPFFFYQYSEVFGLYKNYWAIGSGWMRIKKIKMRLLI